MGRVRSIDRTIPAHYRAQSRGIIHRGCAIGDVVAFFLIEALLSDNGAGATGLRRLAGNPTVTFPGGTVQEVRSRRSEHTETLGTTQAYLFQRPSLVAR